MRWWEIAVGTVFSVGLIAGSATGFLSYDMTEVFGFITGALSVWLTVKENIWLWPISIANNIFFAILFFNARLYADMSLQIVYIVLEVIGWYWWLHGGQGKTALRVGRVGRWEAMIVGAATLGATVIMAIGLTIVNDSSPVLDSITTMLSLAAQYLLTRKFLENWYIWIAADVIYIGLYASRGLGLTSLLYFLFMLMCVVGLRDWNRSLRESPASQESWNAPELVREVRNG